MSLKSYSLTICREIFVIIFILWSPVYAFGSSTLDSSLSSQKKEPSSPSKTKPKRKRLPQKIQSQSKEKSKNQIQKRKNKKVPRKNLVSPEKSLKLPSKKNSPEDQDSSQPELLDIFVIPRILITEKKSLQSKSWWENKKKKVPSIYNKFLKKIRADFKTQGLNINYKLISAEQEINNEKLKKDLYVLSGELILDKKSRSYSLENLRFSPFKDSQKESPYTELLQKNPSPQNSLQMDKTQKNSKEALENKSSLKTQTNEDFSSWIIFSRLKSHKLNSRFKRFSKDIKEEIRFEKLIQSRSEEPQGENYKIIFKNEFKFKELSQIKKQVIKELDIKPYQFQYFTLEKEEYSFILQAPIELLKKIKRLHFVKGPYKVKFLKDSDSLVFDPYTEEDF